MEKSYVMVALVFGTLALVSACSQPHQQPVPEAKNATVLVFLFDKSVVSGSNVHYNVTVESVGSERKFDVALEHRIFSTPLSRVIKTEGEIIHLDGRVEKNMAVSLPSDAPAGNYQLIVGIRYGVNGSADSGGFFEVVQKIEEVVEKAPGELPALPSAKSSSSILPVAGHFVNGSVNASLSSSGSISLTGQATSASNLLPSPPREVIIEHKGRLFVPNKVTVDPGTIVVWINRDTTSAVVDGSGFHSQPLGLNKEFRHTFNKPGIFDFFSSLTKAEGSVIVEDPENPIARKRDPMSFKGGLNS